MPLNQTYTVELVSKGFFVRNIVIIINDLIDFCVERNIKIDGETRAQYVQNK